MDVLRAQRHVLTRSLAAPVAAKAKTDALEVQSQSKGAIKRGKKGKVVVGLFPAKGKKLKGVEISVSGDGFADSKETVSKLDKKKVLNVSVKANKDAEKGAHEVTVTITYSGEAIEIKVPVEVK